MKIVRVRFDGKYPENVVVNNLLQPNRIVYNLDLHLRTIAELTHAYKISD